MSDNNDEIEKKDENEEVIMGTDTIKISNEVVATYAGIAVSEVEGVYGMAGGFAGFTEAISGKKNLSKGIKVDVDEKSVKIDVNIVVEYGARIPDVAYEIQTRIKKTVESMTDLKVTEVNVNVQGVHKAKSENVGENEKEEQVETEQENNE